MCAACWIGWPGGPDEKYLWREGGKPAEAQYADVAATISQFEPVQLLANPGQVEGTEIAALHLVIKNQSHCCSTVIMYMMIVLRWTSNPHPTRPCSFLVCLFRPGSVTGWRTLTIVLMPHVICRNVLPHG